MATTPEEWLEEQTVRISARQRVRADTLKLIATFAAGIAATVAASALQTGETPSRYDIAASIGLAVAAALTALVLLADRLDEPDVDDVQARAFAATPPWTDDRKLRELRKAAVKANRTNQRVLLSMGMLLCLQIGAAVFTGWAAVLSMLQGS